MTPRECVSKAREAKANAGSKSSGGSSTSSNASAAVAEVHNTGSAVTRREALESDCQQKVPKKGLDGRAWLRSALLRKVYKEISDSGSFVGNGA